MTAVRTIEGRRAPIPGLWELDPAHTDVSFVARHLMVTKVRGRFQEVSGAITVGDDPADSRVEVEIQAASITTNSQDRDNHLRSPDFLDVENHPTLSFRSTRIEPLGDDRWALTGDLTIRGVTRPLTLQVTFEGTTTDPWGGTRAAFTARGEIHREDWGLTWNVPLENGGVLVSKNVQIEIDAQAVLKD